MTKKAVSRTEGMQEWLKNEIKKDEKELENEKSKFLKEIKKFKKEDIVPLKKETPKLSLWMKIKKVLMG
jgi:hypothetical protein